MTPLTKPLFRRTDKTISGRSVVLGLAPSSRDVLLRVSLAGQRTGYVVTLSDLYRVAALWHGQAEASAKREARKAGIPWRTARRKFVSDLNAPFKKSN